MGDGLRTIRVVTTDESLLANTRAAASAIEGWEVSQAGSVADAWDVKRRIGGAGKLRGILRPAYSFPTVVRAAADFQVGRVKADIDPDDDRVVRSGSQGDEVSRQARAAWERGERDLGQLRALARSGR